MTVRWGVSHTSRPMGAGAAPVVPCGRCVVGSAPAHTAAAVWLSVWATVNHSAAQTDACSPSPLIHSALFALSFLLLSFYTLALSPSPCSYARLLSATL